MSKLKKIINLLIVLFFILVPIIIIFCFFNKNEKIYSISVEGYVFDKEFNENIYEYCLVINKNIVNINCDTNSNINGCNVSLDLTDKENYSHVIKVRNGFDIIKYVINIKNEYKIEDNDFYIKEVKGNVFEWINQEVMLEVVVSKEGSYLYSFDGGITWQDSNKLVVSENGSFDIVVKDEQGKFTNTTNVVVNKIDKEKPQVDIKKSSSYGSNVVLEVIASDELSGVDSISFNGGTFSSINKYEVNKIGDYHFEIKDKAGNLTESNINVSEDDFQKENKIDNKEDELKTYTLTLKENGSNIEKTSVSCTTTGNSCEVVLPKIITNYKALGWSKDSDATKATYLQGDTLKLKGNMILYAITKKQHTVNFNKNGAANIGKNSLNCTAYNTQKCEVTMPAITTSGTVIGWSTDENATNATYSVNQKIELNSNIELYAITKRTFTATFVNNGLSYLSANSLSCSVYNTTGSCSITLPYFNKPGHFNSFWSSEPEVSSDLSGNKWTWKYFKQSGRTYELTNDVTLYPNFNQFHYDLTKNCYKYRSLNISTSKFIGNTLFEFEFGIPQSAINSFITSMNKAYGIMPWLFTHGKVFVMTESTYGDYSIAYGLTHAMYSSYGGDSYFTIDLQYDTSGKVVKNAIDINAALHELAHAWDSYYNFRTGSGRINQKEDFGNFYDSINSKLYVDSNGTMISKTETFAGMFTNYYWHVLGIDTTKSYYALKSGATLDSTELANLKIIMEKYINISKNGY